MPRTHVLTASVSCLNLGFVAPACSFDLTINLIHLFKLHRRHLDNRGATVHSPQVQSFFELLTVQLDEPDFKVVVKLDFLGDCSVLPLLKVLAKQSSEAGHDCSCRSFAR